MTALLRPEHLAAALVAGILAAWVAGSRGPAMPPVTPMGDQPAYSAFDDPVIVLLEPVLHAPWVGHPPRVVVAAGALFVLLAGLTLSIGVGASTLSASIVLTVLAVDPSFSAVLGHGGRMAFALGFVWLAMAFVFREGASPRRPWLRWLCALTAWALAVWCSWLALVAWPCVFAGVRRMPGRGARGRWTAASIVVGVVAVVAHFSSVAAAAQALAFAPGSAFGWRDAIFVAIDARPRVPPGSYVSPELSTRLPYVALALVPTGLVFGTWPTWVRRSVLLACAIGGAIVVAWPVWQAEMLRFGMWASTPAAAIGLTWLAAQVRRARYAPLVALTLGAIAIAEIAATGMHPLTGTEPRLFRDAFAGALQHAPGTPLVLVAEDTRIDSAIAAWMAARPGAARAVIDGAVVAEALSGGRTVLAAAGARRQLELLGLRLSTTLDLRDPVPYPLASVVGTYHCAQIRSDRWSLLPGIEYTGRLGIQIPAMAGGEMRLIVGDELPLQVRASMPDGQAFPMKIETLLTGIGAPPPPPDYWFEGGGPDATPEQAAELRLAARPAADTLVSLHLGRRSPRVLARLAGDDMSFSRGRICAAAVGEDVMGEGQHGEATVPLRQGALFGTGWYGVEGRGEDVLRWAGADAVVLVPSAERRAVTVVLDAAPAVAPGQDMPPSIALHVNGIAQSTAAMQPGTVRYQWEVPARVWLEGTNEIWFHVSRAVRPADTGGADTRSLAMAVTRIAIAPRNSP